MKSHCLLLILLVAFDILDAQWFKIVENIESNVNFTSDR